MFDRTNAVAPTAGFFLVAKFLPALFATGLTAHLDRFSLRRTLPALYVIEALVFAVLAFLADGDRFFLPLVLAARARSTARWRSPAAGSRAARSRRCCSPRA